MKTQRKITIGLIICILAGIIGRCAGQVSLSETNAVTLKPQVLRKAQSEVDPISQRLTITYAPITERKTWSLKKSLIRAIVPTVWAGASGAVGSITQVNLFKQDALFERFPNLDPVYWDINQSWNNPKFLGAARDSYHDLYKVHSWGCAAVGASIAVPLAVNWNKQRKIHTFIDAWIMLLCSFSAYYATSQSVYNAF